MVALWLTGRAGATLPTDRCQDRGRLCATVCYMSESGRQAAKVGVRELRQNLSIYLDRVKDGETLEVTEHGYPVARLAPLLTAATSRLGQLIAEGRATAPDGDLVEYLATHPPVALPAGSVTATEILLAMRDDERA